ncbi:hypothetical protein TMatcc_004581 [Talaromyces marneffei ATCC 18224]
METGTLPDTKGDETFPSCLFPTFNAWDRLDSGKTVYIRRIELDDTVSQERRERGEEDAVSFFTAVWSTFLHKFLNTEEVSFWLTKHGLINHEEDRCIVKITIGHGQTSCCHVVVTTPNIVPAAQKRYKHMNTRVAFCRSSGLIAETFNDTEKYQLGLVIDIESYQVFLCAPAGTLSSDFFSQLASNIEHIIHQTALHPNLLAQDLNVFSLQNLRQIASWNAEHPILEPSTSNIYELVQTVCQSHADQPAICSWDGQLTYRDLDLMTYRLATYLHSIGIKPNVVVALCFEKSLVATVVLLAVIRSGGAFVFMDPAHPARHKKHILSLAKPSLILHSPLQRNLFNGLDDYSISAPLREITMSTISKFPNTGLDPTVFMPPNNGQDVGMLAFTSGSSGTPKGCVINHSSLASMLPVGDKWPFNAASCNRILQFAPYVFGTSLLETFSALLTAGTVCTPSDAERMGDLVGAMNRMAVTGAVLPASLAQVIDPEAIPSVHTLAVGGEPLTEMLVNKWLKKVKLVQGYGMTENFGILTINDRLSVGGNPRNVGHSPNGRVWLVDPNDYNKLAPVGAVGEILAETPGVACEYLNDPDRSAATFVSEPIWFKEFVLIGKGKFLKTGDLARYQENGSIIHMGRKDSEVKIRGQRVDLRDIEHRLLEYLGDEADICVELINPKKSSAILAAFLWFRNRQQTTDTVDPELQDFVMADDYLRSKLQTVDSSLRNTLPGYMVPSVYLSLAALPTTTTNKVDRRQLRERAAKLTRSEMEMLMHGQKQSVGIVTKTSIEEKLVQLIAETLQLERKEIGSNVNFIRLGGDSLAAMKLANRCQETGISLTVQDILQETNIASLVSRVSSQQQIENDGIQNLDIKESLVAVAQTVIPSPDLGTTGSIAPEDIEDIYPQTGQIDSGRLQAAWFQLTQRHPALRTAFVLNGGVDRQPVQIVLKTGEKARSPQLTVGSTEANKEAIDIRSFPRSHLSIEQLSTQEVLCQLNTNHVAADGISIGIILRDFLLAYDRQLTPGLASNIGDYLKVLTKTSHNPALDFWRTALKSCEPTIFPKMNNITHDKGPAHYHIIDIEIGASSTFSNFSHNHGVTLSNIINVAWALVLQSFTGQQSVCFGYMVSGRDLPVRGIWDAVGLFTNMIVSLVDINPSISLLQLLKETQERFIQTLPFQHVAAIDVFDALGVSMHSLFNSMVSVTNIGTEVLPEAASLKFQMVELLDFSEYDISVELRVEEGSLIAWMKYWDSAFTHDQVQNIASVFKKAVNLLLTDPSQSTNSLYLLSDHDEEQIKQWNQRLPQRIDDCIHHQIQDRCRLQPTAKAVESWDQSLTYQDLAHLSSSLAFHLSKTHGIGPEQTVPVCMDKCSWTPVAMLAILKTGASFLLLEYSQPAQRLRDICRAVRAELVITCTRNVPLSADLGPVEVLCIDQAEKYISPDETFSWNYPSVSPTNTAYLVFTSGSTGTPKGAMVHHSAFLSSVTNYAPRLNLDGNSRVLQLASYSFDVSIGDHLATLLVGGCVCIPRESELKNDTGKAINDYNVNWVMTTPSMSRIISPSSVASRLRTLCLIGEAITTTDITTWSKHVSLMNTYGPAEAAVVSHARTYVKSVEEVNDIGTGLGTLSWIVNQNNHHRLMPVGVVGELILDGPIVGLGYLDDPEKTNASFVDCPSWIGHFRPGNNHSKMYKTGDLVSYTHEGTIVFHGRKNSKVKIRGQWVELSEIEGIVRQYFTGVSAILVDHLEPHSSLVSYVLWDDSSIASKTEDSASGLLLPPSEEFKESSYIVRKAILASVPDHMVPIFLPVRYIPLGPTGKANRRRLQEEVKKLTWNEILEYSWAAREISMPSTETEKKLHVIFSSVLKIPSDKIGVDDDFFGIGGNSLSAMQLVSQSRTVGMKVDLADVFDCRSIVKLALHVDARGSD